MKCPTPHHPTPPSPTPTHTRSAPKLPHPLEHPLLPPQSYLKPPPHHPPPPNCLSTHMQNKSLLACRLILSPFVRAPPELIVRVPPPPMKPRRGCRRRRQPRMRQRAERCAQLGLHLSSGLCTPACMGHAVCPLLAETSACVVLCKTFCTKCRAHALAAQPLRGKRASKLTYSLTF